MTTGQDNNVQQIKSDFWVPVWAYEEKLTPQVAKLNKRASKLGCKPIVITEICREMRPIPGQEKIGPNGKRLPVLGEYVHIHVDGEAPKFAGWRLIARLIHPGETGLKETITNNVPGEEVPERYRTCGPICEHCKSARNRKDTFVVGHDDGRYLAVGSNCIADFLGHQDPKRLAEMATWIFDLATLGDDEMSEWGYGGGRNYSATLEDTLTWAALESKVNGWLTSKDAWAKECPSSSTRIRCYVFGYKLNEYDLKDREKLVAAYQPDDTLEAQAAISWARTLEIDDRSGDYQRNVKLIGEAGVVVERTYGIACSILHAYRRVLGKEMERKAERELSKDSQHVGEIGKRLELEVKVLSVRDLDSEFGVTYLHKLVDRSGNRYAWFGHGNTRLGVSDAWLKIKGTVKAHNEFQGIKETVLNRVKNLGGIVDDAPLNKPVVLTCPHCGRIEDLNTRRLGLAQMKQIMNGEHVFKCDGCGGEFTYYPTSTEKVAS